MIPRWKVRQQRQPWILWAVAYSAERPVLNYGIQTGMGVACSSASGRAYDEQGARVLAEEFALKAFPPADGYTNHKVSLSMVPPEWYKAKA